MSFISKRPFYIFLSILFGYTVNMAQSQNIAVGTWRTHLSYSDAQRVAVGNNWIYCSSANGLFAYNKIDGSLQTIGSLDGLSDAGIADLGYHVPTNTLVIAYQNGNIDLWREDEVINVRSLLNSGRENTEIYALLVEGDDAYFTTGFGGFSFNLSTLSAGDTYDNIGGEDSEGRDMAIVGNELYLSTNLGVYRASLDPGVNRQDVANWSRVEAVEGAASQIEAYEGHLYWITNGEGLYKLEESGAVQVSALLAKEASFMRSTAQGLYIGFSEAVFRLDETGSEEVFIEGVSQVNDLAVDEQQLWLADNPSGLIRIDASGSKAFTPSGTLSSETFRLFSIDNSIIAVAGGFREDNLQPFGRVGRLYRFLGGEWINYSSEVQGTEAIRIPVVQDITSVAGGNGILYVGSYGGGVMRWDLEENTISVDDTGPLEITGLAQDSQGSLWACSADNSLYINEGGNWRRVIGVSNPVELLIDLNDAKWLRQANGGMLLLNDDKSRILRHSEGQGDLRGSRVTAFGIDREGSLWAGTTDGITEFFDSFFTLEGEDGSTVFTIEGLPANQGETVTAIAVDGGNRKWVGTDNGGLWLYDANGNILENFTQENSPLLSNHILSIAIEPATGEVFIATNRGIISYRGTATEGAASHQTVKIFPNPVPPSYDGLISISALVTDAQVRITDAAGQLIWKGQAAGGTVSWDGRNYRGNRAKTGIYFVFSSNADGQDTFVGKVAIVE